MTVLAHLLNIIMHSKST